MSHQPLDDIPVFLFVAVFVVVNFVAYEIGFRLGHAVADRRGISATTARPA